MGKSKSKGQRYPAGRILRLSGFAMGAGVALCAGVAQAAPATDSSSGSDTVSQPLSFPELFKQQVIDGSTVHGRVGIYDFRRFHDTNQPFPGQGPTDNNFDTHNTTPGAQIGIQTGRIYGFSAGAQFTWSSSFDGYKSSDDNINCNLACGKAITDLTQGYLQFNAYGAQIRAGRQLLNTPLAGADQFTFLPRAYNGVSATIRPLEMGQMLKYAPELNSQASASGQTDKYGPQITQARIADNENYETDQYLPFAYNAKTMQLPVWQIFGAKVDHTEFRGNASSFTNDNRYFHDVAGFWSVGTTFHDVTPAGQVIGQYYHYRFQQTESADYGEVGYMAPVMGHGFDALSPYIRAQALAAYDADKDRIPQGINGQIYGLKLGVTAAEWGFSVFGDYAPTHNGSFNHGQLLHPYTDLSGVIYTDTMNDGIQEFGPGWGAGARVDFTPTKNLSMYARYVRYKADYGHYHDFLYGGDYDQLTDASFFGKEVRNQYSDGIGLGMTYDLGGVWKQLAGLKINDNLGITDYDKGAPNFYDNRVRFYYEF